MIALYIVLYAGMKFDLAAMLGDTAVIIFFNLATIAVTIFIAHCSYFFFEKKFINMKKRSTSEKKEKAIIKDNLLSPSLKNIESKTIKN